MIGELETTTPKLRETNVGVPQAKEECILSLQAKKECILSWLFTAPVVKATSHSWSLYKNLACSLGIVHVEMGVIWENQLSIHFPNYVFLSEPDISMGCCHLLLKAPFLKYLWQQHWIATFLPSDLENKLHGASITPEWTTCPARLLSTPPCYSGRQGRGLASQPSNVPSSDFVCGTYHGGEINICLLSQSKLGVWKEEESQTSKTKMKNSRKFENYTSPFTTQERRDEF